MKNLEEVIAFLERFVPAHHQAECDLTTAIRSLKYVKEWEDCPRDRVLCEECTTMIAMHMERCPACGHDRTR
jgi:hypothetical protein